MKTATTLLPLLMLTYAAGQNPGTGVVGGSDKDFLNALLGEFPPEGNGGLVSDNTAVPGIDSTVRPDAENAPGLGGDGGGGGTKPGKVKCSASDDISSLSSEEFLALLAGECEPDEPTPPPPELPEERCERGEFWCTPYHRCNEEDIYSDGLGGLSVRIGLAHFERDRDIIQHSECPRFGDVCCSNPQPASVEPPPTETEYAPQCGQRNSDGLGLRISGFRDSETQFGEFPWMVVVLSIVEIEGEQRLNFVCAGALMHPQVVLTAAHSVNSLEGVQLVVRVGEWDTQRESERLLHEDIDVKTVKLHPDFHPRLLRDDVALLVLERPVDLKPHIDLLCLPEPGVNYDHAECVTAGWGKDALDEGHFQTVLKKVDLPHVPRAECQRKLRRTKALGRYFRLDRSFTCAGGREGEDACKGDGGAALACRDPQQPDRLVALGVVSWGIGCGMRDVPGVYADVRPHLDWIVGTFAEVEREERQEVDLSIFGRMRPLE